MFQIRYLSITLLAQFISLPCTYLEGLGHVWSMAFDLFTSPTEPPKIKAASAHLLTNLTAQIPRFQNSGVVEDTFMPSYVDPRTCVSAVVFFILRYYSMYVMPFYICRQGLSDLMPLNVCSSIAASFYCCLACCRTINPFLHFKRRERNRLW